MSHYDRFLQAVEEMAISIEPLFHDPVNGDFYRKAFLYLTEPERMISFHVPWYVLHIVYVQWVCIITNHTDSCCFISQDG